MKLRLGFKLGVLCRRQTRSSLLKRTRYELGRKITERGWEYSNNFYWIFPGRGGGRGGRGSLILARLIIQFLLRRDLSDSPILLIPSKPYRDLSAIFLSPLSIHARPSSYTGHSQHDVEFVLINLLCHTVAYEWTSENPACVTGSVRLMCVLIEPLLSAKRPAKRDQSQLHRVANLIFFACARL